MINKRDIGKTVEVEIKNYLANFGYAPIKVKGEIIAEFESKTADFCYTFGCYVDKYDEYKLVYWFGIGINRLTQLLKEIDAVVPLDKAKYSIPDIHIGVSPSAISNPLDPARGYKYFSTEEELKTILNEVRDFYTQIFIPFCDKYSDIQELDNLYNRMDDFWENSYGKFPHIIFFHVTRLIIARLANNPNYDKIVEKNFQTLEGEYKKFGGTFDRNDESKPEVFAAKYLRNLKV